jgi:transcription antitermination factor NusG
MSEELENTQGRWYVIHTYSGYENKVKANLEKTVENRSLQDLIFEIKVPTEEQIEEKAFTQEKIERMLRFGLGMTDAEVAHIILQVQRAGAGDKS